MGAGQATGEPVLSPSACASSRRHFPVCPVAMLECRPIGNVPGWMLLALLVLPLISLGGCLPLWVLRVPLTHPASSSTPAPVLCGFWSLPLHCEGWDNGQVDERPVLRLWACPQ